MYVQGRSWQGCVTAGPFHPSSGCVCVCVCAGECHIVVVQTHVRDTKVNFIFGCFINGMAWYARCVYVPNWEIQEALLPGMMGRLSTLTACCLMLLDKSEKNNAAFVCCSLLEARDTSRDVCDTKKTQPYHHGTPNSTAHRTTLSRAARVAKLSPGTWTWWKNIYFCHLHWWAAGVWTSCCPHEGMSFRWDGFGCLLAGSAKTIALWLCVLCVSARKLHPSCCRWKSYKRTPSVAALLLVSQKPGICAGAKVRTNGLGVWSLYVLLNSWLEFVVEAPGKIFRHPGGWHGGWSRTTRSRMTETIIYPKMTRGRECDSFLLFKVTYISVRMCGPNTLRLFVCDGCGSWHVRFG